MKEINQNLIAKWIRNPGKVVGVMRMENNQRNEKDKRRRREMIAVVAGR